jgi:hypothetical protein
MLTVDDLRFGVESCDKPTDLDADDYRDELVEAIESQLQNISRRSIRNAIRDGDRIVVDPDEVWNDLERRLLDEWSGDDEAKSLDPDRSVWDQETDGTVKGYEYTFSGTRSLGEAVLALGGFPWDVAEIDDQCSHHIHVSWSGIATTSTRQCKLYLATIYLLHKASQSLRDCVKGRFDQGQNWAHRYFRPTLDNGRYCAIAQRELGNGTYEFRFLGGIDRAELSIEAVRLVADAAVLADEEELYYMTTIRTMVSQGYNFRDAFTAACCGDLFPDLQQYSRLFIPAQGSV